MPFFYLFPCDFVLSVVYPTIDSSGMVCTVVSYKCCFFLCILMEEASCSSSGNIRSLRRHVELVNWNLCIFCQTDVLKMRLSSVMTKQVSDQIIQDSSFDHKISLRLASDQFNHC